MTATPGKAPKKQKAKQQTEAERLEGLRYIRMMYGPTAGEKSLVSRKTNLGAAYLAHPKFQSLMAAFRKGEAFQFNVTHKEKTFVVAAEGSQILFDGRTLYYSRPANRFEHSLLMDRTTVVLYQANEALVNLAVAVIRSLPDLEAPPITYINHKVYYGSEALEAVAAEQGPNLLVGSFRDKQAAEASRK